MAQKKAYQDTSVSVSRSQAQIRDLLKKHGARGLQFTEDFQSSEQVFRFAFPLPSTEERKREVVVPVCLKLDVRKAAENLPQTKDVWERALRQVHRALYWWLKSQLEAVEFGLLDFTDVFLSYLEVEHKGNVGTIGNIIKPSLATALDSGRISLPWHKD